MISVHLCVCVGVCFVSEGVRLYASLDMSIIWDTCYLFFFFTLLKSKWGILSMVHFKSAVWFTYNMHHVVVDWYKADIIGWYLAVFNYQHQAWPISVVSGTFILTALCHLCTLSSGLMVVTAVWVQISPIAHVMSRYTPKLFCSMTHVNLYLNILIILDQLKALIYLRIYDFLALYIDFLKIFFFYIINIYTMV